jgi:hypothetical protein
MTEQETLYDLKTSGTIRGSWEKAEKVIRLCARKYSLTIHFLDAVEEVAKGNRTYFYIEASGTKQKIDWFEEELKKL